MGYEYPKLIDNKRRVLADVIKNVADKYNKLSIATGYWDLPGTAEVIDHLQNYKSIRLLIGNEPLLNSYLFKGSKPKELSAMIAEDLINNNEGLENVEKRRILVDSAVKIKDLIFKGILEVKIFKEPILHAKAYIFGDYGDQAVGIVGSSNFTKAGLTSNTELNVLEDDYQRVTYKPTSDQQENGHLAWFDEMWNDPNAIKWSEEFRDIIVDSPLGNLTFGSYDSYIKTLMEVYPDELIPPEELGNEMKDILFSFQNRNAGILINKLKKRGVAMLADSVGLGKTITAGAVIKHYLKETNDKANIVVIAPAGLKQQWTDDLSSVLNVDCVEGAYQLVSQQDTNALSRMIEEYKKDWRRKKNIDLFVVDESHNLRSKSGKRHDLILELFQQHPDSHILLLTATPINNSLLDIANQIQLASKGKLKSTNVTYVRPEGKRELIDFFVALNRIQSKIKNAEKKGNSIEKILKQAKSTIHEGLRHYLVRSTRQGVELEGGIIGQSGERKTFPKTVVDNIEYEYSKEISNNVFNSIGRHIDDVFENIDPRKLNLNLMSEFTQQTSHPLDFLSLIGNNYDKIKELFGLDDKILAKNGNLFIDEKVNLILNILQLILVLGFVAYRPDIYQHDNYQKTIAEINSRKKIESLKMQLSVHNILQITWLKRFESSPDALRKSVVNYKHRIELFQKYLDKGYIVSIKDVDILEGDYNYGEDIEQAFVDYEEYLKEKEEILAKGGDASELKKEGIEKKEASGDVYNIGAIKKDIVRDLKILKLLEELLKAIGESRNDIKLNNLARKIKEVLAEGKFGKKVLVFSFFADTINALKEKLGSLMQDTFVDFNDKVEFITGNNKNIDNIVRRFSPKSKKYEIKKGEVELDFLFSTDVLSEGQNLHDAGFLVNYDLHWNPVRMIQRNGRINRLGSLFDSVLISNMKPTQELEMYLNLVHRLENKINSIKNTIGLDQGVLSVSDVNPIEFIEKYYNNGDSDNDTILAENDEHVSELRKFLAKYKDDSKHIDRIKNMPLGKWNYLPKGRCLKSETLSMVKVDQSNNDGNIKTQDVIFIKTQINSGEYIAEYVDYVKALDLIKTTEDDNKREIDCCDVDRIKIRSRVKSEARRQAMNDEDKYRFTPSYEKALINLYNYLTPGIDYKGILERGVNTQNKKKALEDVLKNVNNEFKDTGNINISTINKFMEIFNSIEITLREPLKITKLEEVLNYASRE